MANVTINSLPTASTIDATNDLLPIYTNSLVATQAISRNTYLNLSSQPVGLTDSQTLTNKTLTSPTINNATFSGTLAGTYTIGGTPTFPSSVTQNTVVQTLTNKTLTSPTINSPTITNATISADTLTGYTVSNSGTIYGVPVTTGTISGTYLTASTVGTTQLASASVTPAKLATGGASASTSTAGTTNSTTYVTTLTTSGATPSVTVTIGSNGLALISINMLGVSSSTIVCYTSFVATGANTIAGNDYIACQEIYTTSGAFSYMLTGLTPGSTTFKVACRVSTGTGTWVGSTISVIPL